MLDLPIELLHIKSTLHRKLESDDLGGIKEDQTLNSHNEACHCPLQPSTALVDLSPKSIQYTRSIFNLFYCTSGVQNSTVATINIPWGKLFPGS